MLDPAGNVVVSVYSSGAIGRLVPEDVAGLASFPGFAELKRSLRERPQLRSFGTGTGMAGMEEDWHAGSRRTS